MASAPDDESVQDLRLKYADLVRKYQDLVERSDRRASQGLAIYRLGAFGLRFSPSALAMVDEGRIQLSNARFAQLARSTRGKLVAVEPKSAPSFSDLRALLASHAAEMLHGPTVAGDLLYREGPEVILSIHLERGLHEGREVVLALIEDVAGRARADQDPARTREALLHRERLRVLGELAASIAHDLGNTLRGASFQLSALRGAASAGGEGADPVRAIQQRVELASEVVTRLHDFAHTGALGVTAVRLDRVVSQAAALVDIDFRDAAPPVEVRVGIPELPAVRGSAAELSLLFVNLLRNARDAMPEGGIVTVTGRQTDRAVLVSVADQGKGFSPAVQPRLFEPFFTTKGVRGTGLGLWLASGTMKRLGGTIRAQNRPGGGAVIVLTFPLQHVSRAARPSAARRASARRGSSAHAPPRPGRVRHDGPKT
ncbi:MAG TPA: HAMP domain-containing sensor histidine kinase [Myxococcales bacterium]|nr:HAMP domain-containing sensor histidine kinase [Myxococcales bacterium]